MAGAGTELPAVVDVVVDDHTILVTLSGAIGTRTAADIRIDLCRAVDRATDLLVVDLSEAEIADATGLGLLVEVWRRARRAGLRIHVAGMSERTRRLLRGIRLERGPHSA